jgi:hypothetical protein
MSAASTALLPDAVASAEREAERTMQPARPASVDLYWIPLGAGGHSVRFNGMVFEAIAAAWEHRPRCDLYHAALLVSIGRERYVVELAPAFGGSRVDRGVVRTGAVGSRLLGWSSLFRYELRCWRDGTIPDLGFAVGGPRTLTTDPVTAGRLLDSVARVPTPVWGRDELKAGEMWNSNSVIAWLIAQAGIRAEALHPPTGGRAPGWGSGVAVARRAPT